MKSLSVVIPSRNGEVLLRRYLPVIHQETVDCGGELIVVDDCSSDGTKEFLIKSHPSATIIERKGEPAFCRAVNLGMSQASGDYLLLLNNDTIPEKGSFAGLVAALSRSSDTTAAAVPAIPRPDGTDDSLFRCGFVRGLAVTGQDATGLPYPSGACALWKKEAWNSLGGLDCRYSPIYWEDADMGLRMHKMGYRMIHCSSITVRHMHAATMGASPDTRALRERNRFIFMNTHFARGRKGLSTMLWMPVHLAAAFLRGNRAFLRGYFDYREWRRKR